jgi:hypothetical protein
VDEFAGIGFIISPGLAFQPALDGLLDLGQPFKAVLDGLEALVGAVRGINSCNLARLRIGFKGIARSNT